MPDTWINALLGGGGGLLSSMVYQFVVLLGLKERIAKLEDTAVTEKTCEKCSEKWQGSLNTMHEEIRAIRLNDLKELGGKVDQIVMRMVK